MTTTLKPPAWWCGPVTESYFELPYRDGGEFSTGTPVPIEDTPEIQKNKRGEKRRGEKMTHAVTMLVAGTTHRGHASESSCIFSATNDTSCWLGPANGDHAEMRESNNYVEAPPEIRKSKKGKRWFVPVSRKTKRNRGERQCRK